jgi:hypothetical protein
MRGTWASKKTAKQLERETIVKKRVYQTTNLQNSKEVLVRTQRATTGPTRAGLQVLEKEEVDRSGPAKMFERLLWALALRLVPALARD